MSEGKHRILLGIGLVGAIIYALNYYIPKLTADKETPLEPVPVTAATSPQATAAKIASTIDQIDLESEQAKSWGTDPFRSRKVKRMPTRSVREPASSWTLSGIVMGGSKPMAIINSRGVSEGDEIDGARVIQIESRRVVIERGGERITLKVNKG
jgi:type II secretory pathway component PulC